MILNDAEYISNKPLEIFRFTNKFRGREINLKFPNDKNEAWKMPFLKASTSTLFSAHF